MQCIAHVESQGHFDPRRLIPCSKLSDESSMDFLHSLQVVPEPQETHIVSSKLGKPYNVGRHGPGLPANNAARAETVRCILSASKNADPALGECVGTALVLSVLPYFAQYFFRPSSVASFVCQVMHGVT